MGEKVRVFHDRALVAAAVAQAKTRRQALIIMGITPGQSMYRRLAEACERFDLAVPAPIPRWEPDAMTKMCTGCRAELPVERFAIKSRRTGRRQSRCRACMAELRHDHYERNRLRLMWEVTARKREVKLRNMIRIVDHLAQHPCVDCGEVDPLVLEFDHVVDDKLANISEMVHLADWSRISAEIAKCVVRCANCHRRKTLLASRHLRAVVVQRAGHLPSKQAVTGFESPLPLSSEGVDSTGGAVNTPDVRPASP